jgi:hypothetical protein
MMFGTGADGSCSFSFSPRFRPIHIERSNIDRNDTRGLEAR